MKPPFVGVVNSEYNVNHVTPEDKYSTLNKLLRVTALVLLFIKKIKRKKNNKEITKTLKINSKQIIASNDFLECLKEARMTWVTHEQRKFLDGRTFEKLKQQLELYQDDKGLWRCEGRFKNTELDLDTKNPILIPKSKFSQLVVEESHRQVNHNGLRNTLNQTRRTYFITQPNSYTTNENAREKESNDQDETEKSRYIRTVIDNLLLYSNDGYMYVLLK